MYDEFGNSRRGWSVAIVVIAVGFFALLLYIFNRPCPDSALPWHCESEDNRASTTITPAATGVVNPAKPAGDVGQVNITFATSDTKANWISAVTKTFNDASRTIQSGKSIHVEVIAGDSGVLKEDIVAGRIQPTIFSPGEMSWVNEASGGWQLLHNKPLVHADCPPTIITPIGIGMWQPMAQAMGWPDKPIGWKDILALANDPDGWGEYGHPEWGPFKFGHTHPLQSNTGRLALLSLAYASLGQTDGLTPVLVKSPEVIHAIEDLEMHSDHYGLSSRGLLTRMAELGPGFLSAATTSEANLLNTNAVQGDKMQYPLVFIPPAEGTFWSDNPYCTLDGDWVTDEQVEAAQVYLDFLLDKPQQYLAMKQFYLRPINTTIPYACPLCLEAGTDPNDTPENVPALATVSGATADTVDDVFIEHKKKAIIVVVLDRSQSMQGEKIKQATEATAAFLKSLANKDKNDDVYVITFNKDVTQLTPGGPVGKVAEDLSNKVTTIFSEGGTALYDAICQAGELAKQQQAAYAANGRQRLAGIVVLSDGADTSSVRTESDVFNFCLPKGEDLEGIPVYTIAYGADAEENFLIQIANYTNGKFYKQDADHSLTDIYNGIAYEQ